jgi:hypothetical protein
METKMIKLKVDHSIHKRLGMRILTEEDVVGLRAEKPYVEYPEDYAFEPKGITFKEAQEMMKRIMEC